MLLICLKARCSYGVDDQSTRPKVFIRPLRLMIYYLVTNLKLPLVIVLFSTHCFYLISNTDTFYRQLLLISGNIPR